MKLLLDIHPDNLSSVMDFFKNFTDVKVEKITDKDADLLTEIKEIKKAFLHAEMLSLGKLKAKPVENLLNDL
jgi:hypothetical protein